tara:strand:+ start:226 stop:1005 length:780 start_codon:yes stop_codon:yes gene_type:complete
MKKILAPILLIALLFAGCGVDNDDNIAATVSQPVSVSFKLATSFDDIEINDSNFANLQLTNANGEIISIDRIRYMISKVELINQDTNVSYTMKDYNLLDISDNSTYTFNSEIQIPNGDYKLKLVWGFNETDNVDGAYADLNLASWNWPQGLGGGYHFLQFDGKYNINTSPMPFNFHNGTAKNANGDFEQNFVTFSFDDMITINGNSQIEIKTNIAELFRNPNTWDLNVLDTPLMPNYMAQKMMQQNVATVFNVGAITPQ